MELKNESADIETQTHEKTCQDLRVQHDVQRLGVKKLRDRLNELAHSVKKKEIKKFFFLGGRTFFFLDAFGFFVSPQTRFAGAVFSLADVYLVVLLLNNKNKKYIGIQSGESKTANRHLDGRT